MAKNPETIPKLDLPNNSAVITGRRILVIPMPAPWSTTKNGISAGVAWENRRAVAATLIEMKQITAIQSVDRRFSTASITKRPVTCMGPIEDAVSTAA